MERAPLGVTYSNQIQRRNDRGKASSQNVITPSIVSNQEMKKVREETSKAKLAAQNSYARPIPESIVSLLMIVLTFVNCI